MIKDRDSMIALMKKQMKELEQKLVDQVENKEKKMPDTLV